MAIIKSAHAFAIQIAKKSSVSAIAKKMLQGLKQRFEYATNPSAATFVTATF